MSVEISTTQDIVVRIPGDPKAVAHARVVNGRVESIHLSQPEANLPNLSLNPAALDSIIDVLTRLRNAIAMKEM